MADASHDDPIHHPPHYTFGAVEVIDAIEAWALGFHLGNAVKYIARAGRKGDRLQDLRKARWYLDREIERAMREDVTGGVGSGVPCCPKCASPHRAALANPSWTMLRCDGCNNVWERAEVTHG